MRKEAESRRVGGLETCQHELSGFIFPTTSFSLSGITLMLFALGDAPRTLKPALCKTWCSKGFSARLLIDRDLPDPLGESRCSSTQIIRGSNT